MAKKAPATKPARSGKPGSKVAARTGASASEKSKKSATHKPTPTKTTSPKSGGKAPSAKPAAKSKGTTAAKAPLPAKPALKPTSSKVKPSVAVPSKPTKSAAKGGDKPTVKGAAPSKTTGQAKASVSAKGGVKPVEPAPAAPVGDPKGARKGITIVSNKPKRPSTKPPRIEIPKTEPLLGPGSPFRKPLIASGPGAARRSLEIDAESLAKIKSPFNKKELQRFRDILLKKRADLVGDVSDLESEALLGRSGSLSALPQHIAEQGSETYEQSLSLNLAAEDRRLIREIDAALQRIDRGTFGICEMTGKPINRERLEELPWTRFSIDAAREMERRIATGQAPPSALGR